jgi:hypothetical protein
MIIKFIGFEPDYLSYLEDADVEFRIRTIFKDKRGMSNDTLTLVESLFAPIKVSVQYAFVPLNKDPYGMGYKYMHVRKLGEKGKVA